MYVYLKKRQRVLSSTLLLTAAASSSIRAQRDLPPTAYPQCKVLAAVGCWSATPLPKRALKSTLRVIRTNGTKETSRMWIGVFASRTNTYELPPSNTGAPIVFTTHGLIQHETPEGAAAVLLPPAVLSPWRREGRVAYPWRSYLTEPWRLSSPL